MDLRTPADWVAQAATEHGDHPALLMSGGPVDYATLDREIDERVRSLPEVSGTVPVHATLDLPGIVDLLAHMRAGACVMPIAPGRRAPAVHDDCDAPVCLETSGSTGAPRLVPLSMANLIASVEASALRLETGPDDRWLACLPLHHIGGLSVLFRTFAAGGTAVVASFDDRLIGVIEATRPTMASMVPTMVHRLESMDAASLGGIGRILVGGASLDAHLARSARTAGAVLLPTYGMTETSSQVATARSGDHPDREGYVGRPLDGFVVTVEAGFGEPGLVAVEGPAVFDGYLGEPPRVGPFVTGDIGHLDADGSLVIIGRADDVIISGGENVSLGHVERVLRSLDGVNDAVVVGMPDPEWGHIVGAMIVTDRPVDAIRSESEHRLERHERPKCLLVVSSIPLLDTGKPDRRAIEAGLADETSSR